MTIIDKVDTKSERDHWREVAVKNGIKRSTFNKRVNRNGWSPKRAATHLVVHNNEFAVYKGDEFIVMGTKEECADFLEVKPEYVSWLTTPAAKRRLEKMKNPEKAITAIRIYEDDDE